MDLKRAQQTTIPGYEHPESTNVNRNSQYKTFTEGGKKTKKFGTTTVGKQYATVKEIKIDGESCPKCSLPSLETCPCAYSDKKCEEGHIWFTSRDGNVRLGDPHKKR